MCAVRVLISVRELKLGPPMPALGLLAFVTALAAHGETPTYGASASVDPSIVVRADFKAWFVTQRVSFGHEPAATSLL